MLLSRLRRPTSSVIRYRVTLRRTEVAFPQLQDVETNFTLFYPYQIFHFSLTCGI